MAKPKKTKNGRWEIRPRYKNVVTGQWVSKRRIFDTAAEARAYEAQVIADANMGVSSASVTLVEYSQHWLNIYKKPFVEKRTVARIQADLNHVLKFFTERKQLTSISKGTYQLFLNTLGKDHAHATLHSVHTTFKAMMECAVDEGVVTHNPCKGAKYGGVPRELNDPRQEVLTLAEFKTLLAAIASAPESVSKYLCITQALTGMRIGEVLGLRWDKVNEFNHTITIDGQYDYYDTQKRIHLKDHTEPRTIKVQPELFNYLQTYKEWRKSEYNASHVVSMDGYIFTGSNGKPLSPASPNKYLAKYCKSVGITRITTHGWRRTQATLMKLGKVDDKFIASFLGHSVETLEKFYIKQTSDLISQSQTQRDEFFRKIGIG